ncbi:hypothetical protein M1146_07625 [Patescibacteria group bacterium]|nr:hypothetical protein [Patescibacteria group bacterium]
MEEGLYTVRGLAVLRVPASIAFKVGSGMDYWPVIDPYCVDGTNCFSPNFTFAFHPFPFTLLPGPYFNISLGRQVKSIDENHEILYSRYDTGIPLIAQREFVFLESRKQEDGKYLIVDFGIDDEIAKGVESFPGSVRGM